MSSSVLQRSLLLALPLWLSGTLAAADAAILQIQILEGEGAVHIAGSKSSRPLVVQIVDEVGRPVPGVAVGFRLPEQEPSGLFSGGLKTDIQATSADGRVAVWGIQWGRQTGPVRLRITAAKGEVRAGTICSIYLAEPAATVVKMRGRRPSLRAGLGSRWLTATLAAATATAAGVALRSRGGKTAAEPAAATLLQIGPPSITVGSP